MQLLCMAVLQPMGRREGQYTKTAGQCAGGKMMQTLGTRPAVQASTRRSFVSVQGVC